MAAAIAVARRAFASRCVASHSLPLSASSRPFPSPSPSPATACAGFSRRKLRFGISRLPIELGCAQSLMPFHSATATALLTSMLSARCGSWTWLSEEYPNGMITTFRAINPDATLHLLHICIGAFNGVVGFTARLSSREFARTL